MKNIKLHILKHLLSDAYFLRPFLLGCRMEKSSISEESVSCRSNSWAEQDPDPFLRPFLLFEPILPFETRASSSLRFFIFLYCLTCTSSLLVGSTVLLNMTMVFDFFRFQNYKQRYTKALTRYIFHIHK